MSPSTFDPAKFVSEIEGMGAELRPVVPVNGTPTIKFVYGWNVPKAHIDARWNEEITSPEHRRAVIDYLIERQG
jgi:hypothetical protein